MATSASRDDLALQLARDTAVVKFKAVLDAAEHVLKNLRQLVTVLLGEADGPFLHSGAKGCLRNAGNSVAFLAPHSHQDLTLKGTLAIGSVRQFLKSLLQPSHLTERYITSLTQKRARTRHGAQHLLRTAQRYEPGAAPGHAPHKPLRQRGPAARSTRGDVLPRACLVAALAAGIDPYYKPRILTAAYTGLRAGELLALRISDIDFLRATLRVARAHREVNGHITTGPTKTPASRRTVSLPAFLVTELSQHLKALKVGGPDALVFPGKSGKPLRHNLFYRRHFKPAVYAALPAEKHGLRFHDLRHTCASLLVNAGAHPLLVSKQLGHSSVQITLDRYSHLFPNVAEALAEQLDAVYAHAGAHPREEDEVAEVAELRPN